MHWAEAELLRGDVADANPAVWFIRVDGLVLHARHVAVEIRAEAFMKGIIPYIPALSRDRTAAFPDKIDARSARRGN